MRDLLKIRIVFYIKLYIKNDYGKKKNIIYDYYFIKFI